jgi:hypothetical protein
MVMGVVGGEYTLKRTSKETAEIAEIAQIIF